MMDMEIEQAAIQLPAQQRWIAAQALAAGDTLARAAAEAGTRKAVLEWLLDNDEEFSELLESEQALGELDEEAWNRHAERKMRQTIDRLLALNRVAAVSLAARLCGVLDALRQRGKASADDPDEEPGSVEDFLRSLGDDKLTEFESWGQRRYFGPGTPNDPHHPLHPPGEAAAQTGLRLVGVAEDAAAFEPAPPATDDDASADAGEPPAGSLASPEPAPSPEAPRDDAKAMEPGEPAPAADADAAPLPEPAVDSTEAGEGKGQKAPAIDHAAFFKPAREPLPWHLRRPSGPSGTKPP